MVFQRYTVYNNIYIYTHTYTTHFSAIIEGTWDFLNRWGLGDPLVRPDLGQPQSGCPENEENQAPLNLNHI